MQFLCCNLASFGCRQRQHMLYFTHVCACVLQAGQCASLIKRLLPLLDTSPSFWLDWDRLTPGNGHTCRGVARRARNHCRSVPKHGRKERERSTRAREVFGYQLDYELYIKTTRPKENDRGKAAMSRTSSVTLEMSKRFFPHLLKLTVRQTDPLCS